MSEKNIYISTKRQKKKKRTTTFRLSKGPAAQQSRLIVRPAGKEDRRIKAAGADRAGPVEARAVAARKLSALSPESPPCRRCAGSLWPEELKKSQHRERERRDKVKDFFGFVFVFCFLCVPAYLPRRHRQQHHRHRHRSLEIRAPWTPPQRDHDADQQALRKGRFYT